LNYFPVCPILDAVAMSGPSSPSNLSSVTLVGSTGSGSQDKSDDTPTEGTFLYGKAPTSPLPERVHNKYEQQQPPPLTPSICMTDMSSDVPQQKISPVHAPPTVTTTYCFTGNEKNGDLAVFHNGHESPRIVPSSPATTKSISPPHLLPTDRRPSVGCNVIPHAALCQVCLF
jgi:hypothetical protein